MGNTKQRLDFAQERYNHYIKKVKDLYKEEKRLWEEIEKATEDVWFYTQELREEEERERDEG